MKITAESLTTLTRNVFLAAGCEQAEADCVADHLVKANLSGHDSHGVIRIARYLPWLRKGLVLANQKVKVVIENDAMAMLDGCSGMGQAIGTQAVRMGIEKSDRSGVSVVALGKVGHLGRIGHWAEMAADAGRVSVHFVNTTGLGGVVAPFGGMDRRLSVNPIAAGVPVAGADPVILDISTTKVAEGKIILARTRGEALPADCIIDGEGRPSTDPNVFYDDPGAMLPFGGHKGYGLGIIADLLAGALTVGGCTNPANNVQLHNGMLSIYIDPRLFGDESFRNGEIHRFIDYVKSSRTIREDGQVLMPGELEALKRKKLLRDGIELDGSTCELITAACESLEVDTSLLRTD